jgi:flagellar basal body L-ring protein FlgH
MRTPKPTLLIAATALAVFFLTNAPAQSLWRDDVAKPMFADKRATSVGDIVTILVQENSQASP